jgi:hypothetical protein
MQGNDSNRVQKTGSEYAAELMQSSDQKLRQSAYQYAGQKNRGWP